MNNSVEVFDFKEEDELSEFQANKFSAKLKNPSVDNHAPLKYEFLGCAAQGSDAQKMEISNVCIDVDETECEHSCDNATTQVSLRLVREDFSMEEGNSAQDVAPETNSPSPEGDPTSMINNYHLKNLRVPSSEAPSIEQDQLNCALSDSPSNIKPDDAKSDAAGNMDKRVPSCPASDIAEVILSDHTSNNDYGNLEMDGISIKVDYAVHRDNYCAGCLVTFSSSAIKVNCSALFGDHETFSFETGIDDVVHIKSQHLQRLQTVKVKLQVLSKAALHSDNEYNTSGIEDLEFAVVEPNWSQKWEEIVSLNVKYAALWARVHGMDVMVDGVSDLLPQRPYFPNFQDNFEDVIYPKGDVDAVSINKRDVDLLQPETFINDTIIDFYIKYLKNQIPPEERHRFHFFNSFFFRKLADLDKDPSSASDGRAAFLRVHKWTRKVDIFAKDYIFIPVNFNLHWSLLVICHLGDVAGFKDEDVGSSLRVPCILHLDSIKGTHAGLKNLVQSYLWEEWKERRKEISEDLSSKFLNLRFVSLELPQQENSFDCGLFLLHYLELFLVEAPENFNPFRINEFSKFLNVDWFPPVEASLKRTRIQRLISELLEMRFREFSSGSCNDKLECNFPEVNEKGGGVELVSPVIACHANLSSSEAGQGIGISQLEASARRNPQCVNDQGLVLREFFEPGIAAGSLLARCSSFDQSASYYHLNGVMSQIEDDAEAGEQLLYFPSGEPVFSQSGSITPQVGAIPYPFRGFGADASWNPGVSMQRKDDDSSSEPSTSASTNSDVGIIESCQVEEDLGPGQKVEAYQQGSPSMENVECLTNTVALESGEMVGTFVVGVTEAPTEVHNGNDNCDLPTYEEDPTPPLLEDPMTVENKLRQDSMKAEATNDDMTEEPAPDEHKPAKRLRLTPSVEGEGGATGTMSDDLHLQL